MDIQLINKLITFEGIDGSGKSTQIQLLNNWFDSNKIKINNIREPGGNNISEVIREVLLDRDNKINSFSETLLFLASRAQLVDETILPLLAKDEFVICDRFIDSTVVYQGYGRGLDIKKLEEINHIATAGLTPDITFILDINPEVASARMAAESPDRMEATGMEFFRRIQNGYCQIKDQNPNRCRVINGEQSPENVFKEIKEILMERFEEVLTCS